MKRTAGLICILLCTLLFLSACVSGKPSSAQATRPFLETTTSLVENTTPSTEDATHPTEPTIPPTEPTAPPTEPTTPPAENVKLPQAYQAIITNIINAYPWNDSDMDMVPENPELSYLYRLCKNLSDVGFACIDLDNNGQEELILTDVNVGDVNTGFIFDLYTISDGNAVHLADSGERYRYYLLENGLVEYIWSGGASLNGHDYYRYADGELCLIEKITRDADYALDSGLISDFSEATDENTFFRSTSDRYEDYQPISFDEAMRVMDTYKNENKPLTIEYTLLSEYQN